MAKRKKSNGKTKKQMILEFGDMPAADVVDALKKKGIETTIAGVYSARHTQRRKPGPRSSAAPKPTKRKIVKKKLTKTPVRKRPAKRRAAPPAAPADDGIQAKIEAADARAELAAEKARNQVYQDLIDDLRG